MTWTLQKIDVIVQNWWKWSKFDVAPLYNLKRPSEADLSIVTNLKIQKVFWYNYWPVCLENSIHRAKQRSYMGPIIPQRKMASWPQANNDSRFCDFLPASEKLLHWGHFEVKLDLNEPRWWRTCVFKILITVLENIAHYLIEIL